MEDPRRVGRYRILARLGAGGMGRVYLGRSASGRAVAVKVLRAELAEDTGFRRRFAREVEAARRVTGFFTAAVVDADLEGSPAWLATAYVPGMSLEAAVHTHGAWSQRSVLALGAGLAEALEAIHGAGLVHRDLKPSNVLLSADGPRLIDFGISAVAGASVLTETGKMVGTPGFMSPEQVTGKAFGPASDVFSLGAVLAFAATGVGPFGTGSALVVNFRAVYQEPDLGGLPPGLDVIGQCLAKDPGQRPTVPDLVAALARALGESDGHTTATEVLAEADWLPDAVAQSLLTHAPPPQLQRQDQGHDDGETAGDGAAEPSATSAGALPSPSATPTVPPEPRHPNRKKVLAVTAAMLTAVLGVVALTVAQTMPWREKPSGQPEATFPATTTTGPDTSTLPTKPAQGPVSDLSGTVNTADTLKMTTATPTSSGFPTTPAGLTSGGTTSSESTEGKKVPSSTDPSPTSSPSPSPTTTDGGGTIGIGLLGGLLGG
ncbi:serine/threonine-protein kinase [Streptomyces sp. NPDC050743]|uniref:serine/threonine-protein kinase n=1 Tax=Streptomyces sp. NPDC050743 TaxID=3365634 RepID=UPI00379D87ED